MRPRAILDAQIPGPRFEHCSVMFGNLETGKAAAYSGGIELLNLQPVLASAGQHARNNRSVGRPRFQNARLPVKLPPAALLEIFPQRIGPLHQRNVRGLLVISLANQPRLTM